MAKSAKQVTEKSPRPGFRHWEAIADIGEGGRGCRGLASGNRGVGEQGQDKGVFQGWGKSGRLSELGQQNQRR